MWVCFIESLCSCPPFLPSMRDRSDWLGSYSPPPGPLCPALCFLNGGSRPGSWPQGSCWNLVEVCQLELVVGLTFHCSSQHRGLTRGRRGPRRPVGPGTDPGGPSMRPPSDASPRRGWALQGGRCGATGGGRAGQGPAGSSPVSWGLRGPPQT